VHVVLQMARASYELSSRKAVSNNLVKCQLL